MRATLHPADTGHSFGIEAHEAPLIRPGDKTPLLPGMVSNIRPMALDAEGICFYTEDHILTTEADNRMLTQVLAADDQPWVILPMSSERSSFTTGETRSAGMLRLRYGERRSGGNMVHADVTPGVAWPTISGPIPSARPSSR